MAKRMSEFGKTVIAAIDLEGDWNNVVDHAVDYARPGGAMVHLVHVVEEPGRVLSRSLTTKDLKALGKRLVEEARERLADAVKRVEAQGLQAVASVAHGKPAREILAVAEEMNAGLIVCGAGVTEGVEWLVMGTTPDRLLRNSEVPVLIVGPAAAGRLRRVLVPTDLDRPDQGALRVGARLAARHGGRLSVLHVFAEPSLVSFRMGDTAKMRRELKAAAKTAFEEFVAMTPMPEGAKPPHKLLVASTDKVNAAEEILAEAARLKMDLIVMALGGQSLVRSFVIGSVAEKVIRRLPCSLLALPSGWAKKR